MNTVANTTFNSDVAIKQGIAQALAAYPELKQDVLEAELANAQARLAGSELMKGSILDTCPCDKESTKKARSDAYATADSVKNGAIAAAGGNPIAIGVALAAYAAACAVIDRTICD